MKHFFLVSLFYPHSAFGLVAATILAPQTKNLLILLTKQTTNPPLARQVLFPRLLQAQSLAKAQTQALS